MESYDLIIIGGGPAGLSAGIYASRKKLKTILITKDFAGQLGLTLWVENYPGFKKIKGQELMENLKNQLAEYDITIKNFEEANKIEILKDKFRVITSEGDYLAEALIISTGALAKRLNILNEEKFIGRGISYCLTCDEKSFEGKPVAIIGGGNAGLEAALELAQFSPKVYLLEFLNNLTGDEILKEAVLANKNIEVVTGVELISFEGELELQKIIFKDRRTDEKKEILVDGCFVEIGTKPHTEFLEGLIELNERKEIVINPKTMETSVKGIFAAGDVCDFKHKQIILAAAQGALAALSAYQYLKEKNERI